MATDIVGAPDARQVARKRLVGVIALILLSVSSVPAQEWPRDSLPFRRGQWAAQFTASSDHRNVGVLRFRTKRTAWLIDGQVGASSSEQDAGAESSDSSRSVEETSGGGVHVRLRTGLRRYRALTATSVTFGSAGLVGGYDRSNFEATYLFQTADTLIRHQDNRRVTGWTGGIFGEVGASHFITRNVSVGVIASVQAEYGRDNSRDGTHRVTRSRWGIDSSILSFVATVYF